MSLLNDIDKKGECMLSQLHDQINKSELKNLSVPARFRRPNFKRRAFAGLTHRKTNHLRDVNVSRVV